MGQILRLARREEVSGIAIADELAVLPLSPSRFASALSGTPGPGNTLRSTPFGITVILSPEMPRPIISVGSPSQIVVTASARSSAWVSTSRVAA
jgi:hypothetical protein